MPSHRRNSFMVLGSIVFAWAIWEWSSPATAQPDKAGSTANPVVIQRDPVHLLPAESYRVTMRIRPVKEVELVSLADGIVSVIHHQSGKKVDELSEVLRLESKDLQLALEKAKAELEVTELEKQVAVTHSDSTKHTIALAEAKIKVAKIAVQQAELALDRTILRTPFAGTVAAVHVEKSEFVRAGRPLMTVVDLSQMTVEVPVDRSDKDKIAVDQEISLKIGDETVTGTIKTILPPPERFEALRDLIGALGMAEVVIDNADGKYLVGQSVYTDLVPTGAVALVQNKAITVNPEKNAHTVQVIRDGVIKDLSVEVFAAVGEDKSYVSGAFAETDEVIRSSSVKLADGTRVAPAPNAAPNAAGKTGTSGRRIIRRDFDD